MSDEEILLEAKKVSSVFYLFKGREHTLDTLLDNYFNELKSLNVFSDQKKKLDFLENINHLCLLKGLLSGGDAALRFKEKTFSKHKINKMLQEV